MAHIAKTYELIDNLIDTIIISPSKVPQNEWYQGYLCPSLIVEQQDLHVVDLARRDALQLFANARFVRTNQYEVDAHFHGLDEKLRILNNDELADVLQNRLIELSKTSHKWMPEILSLLLQLCDNPAEKSRIEDLDDLKHDFLPLPLTWAEIIAEDPLDNRSGVWDSIDYAANSSDGNEDDADDDSLQTSKSVIPTSEPTELLVDLPAEISSLDNSDGDELLQKTFAAQFWRNGSISPNLGDKDYLVHGNDETTTIVTETQMIRETVFMLLGLPTSTYICNTFNLTEPVPRYQVRYMSESLFRQLLEDFAHVGDKTNFVRHFVKQRENAPLIQTFQAAVSSRLRDVDRGLIAIEVEILKPNPEETVTLISLREKVLGLTKPLLYIQEIIQKSKLNKSKPITFRILELLYEYTALYQNIGELMAYSYIADIFLQVFQFYLKSIQSWMECGNLSDQDSDFFIQAVQKHAPPSALWQSHFSLIYDTDGGLHAPNFLHISVQKIFTTGKSINFLEALGHDVGDRALSCSSQPEFRDTIVFGLEGSSYLRDFPELFNSALNKWITARHHVSSQLLRDQLGSKCGLWNTLEVLETIYLWRNGALSGHAAGDIFDRLDRRKRSWDDSFYLTELFREVFGVLPNIDVQRLRVRSRQIDRNDMPNKRNTVRMLVTIRVEYLLPWPIANIVRKESIQIYQRIFIFLMQLERAKQIMERYRLRKSTAGAKERNRGRLLLLDALHQKFLWFLHTLQSYLTSSVLCVATEKMHNDLRSAEDVDGMIKVHEDYASHLEDQCLLGTSLSSIYQAILSIFDLAVQFAGADTASLRTVASNVDSSVSNKANTYRQRGTPNLDASSEDEDNEDGAPTNYLPFGGSSYLDHLNKMHDSFLKLQGIVLAGLQGVSRAGGEASWAVLAESLIMNPGDRAK